MAMAATIESLRDQFLRECKRDLNFWLNESRAADAREKMIGLVFSMLVSIDGFSGGPYPLHAIDWEKPEDDPSREVQISLDLHDNWHRILDEP